jgi:hypothetical protein
MPKLAAILNVFAIALTFVPSLNAQQLNFDEENVITITQNDGPKGTGRYKEFYMNVNQGDQLSFDIKGKSGVDVPTVVELYPIRSNITNYRTPRELTKQIWTSAPLPSCQLKIKIIAYPPYGPLSVVVKKSNPNNPPAQQPAPAQRSLEIEKMSKAELLQRHREILEELQRIAEEIAKR